ncbi:hypothetical protein ACFQ36_03280 [Arthrobacter sp. GCM10027362]|uniref:hypothetical protein n=1 Tax=Arthrobacter sp. GCM10027362 TaxID=3273379 RepID=UPI00362AE742
MLAVFLFLRCTPGIEQPSVPKDHHHQTAQPKVGPLGDFADVTIGRGPVQDKARIMPNPLDRTGTMALTADLGSCHMRCYRRL